MVLNLKGKDFCEMKLKNFFKNLYKLEDPSDNTGGVGVLSEDYSNQQKVRQGNSLRGVRQRGTRRGIGS